MDRNKIDNLIVYLMAISNYAKDIHYHCKGENFYSNHLFADRIQENLSEYIDQLKEICLLGHGFDTLDSSIYLIRTGELVPKNNYNFRIMHDLLLGCLEEIETITGISKGDENLIGAIAQDVQNNVGLINIMLGDYGNV